MSNGLGWVCFWIDCEFESEISLYFFTFHFPFLRVMICMILLISMPTFTKIIHHTINPKTIFQIPIDTYMVCQVKYSHGIFLVLKQDPLSAKEKKQPKIIRQVQITRLSPP